LGIIVPPSRDPALVAGITTFGADAAKGADEAALRLAARTPHANIAHRGGTDCPNGGNAMTSTMTPARLAAALLLCGMMAAPFAGAKAQALKKINDGQVSRTAPNWPSFIAAEKGFFRREGVELETTYVGNVANTVQQLVAGSFDVASSTFDTAIRAIGNGGNAVMIGGVVTKYPYSIMTAADVKSAADMKGKRVILPFPKDLLTIVWNRWLIEKGMRPDDVEQMYAGATPNRLAALVSGAVQGALLTAAVRFPRRGSGLSQVARHRRLRQGVRLPDRAGATAMAARQPRDRARLSACAFRRRRLVVRPGQPRRGDCHPGPRDQARTRDR
jgi:hypothetical protein